MKSSSFPSLSVSRVTFVAALSLAAVACNKNKSSAASPTPAPFTGDLSVPSPGTTPFPGTQPLGGSLQAFPQCAGEENELPDAKIKITAFDVIVPRGTNAPVAVQAKIERRIFSGLNPDLRNIQVQFQGEAGVTATAVSGADGIANAQLAAQAGSTGFSCIALAAENQVGLGRIYAIEPSAPIVVVDIDEVISNVPELSVPLTSIQNSPVVPGAPEALSRLAADHRIVYLTARDDALFNKTRAWLALKGFPRGPLLVWDWTIKNGLGISNTSQRVYKEARLRTLKSQFPNLKAGIGNKVGDAQAYASVGMRAVMLGTQNNSYAAGTRFGANWTELEAAVRAP